MRTVSGLCSHTMGNLLGALSSSSCLTYCNANGLLCCLPIYQLHISPNAPTTNLSIRMIRQQTGRTTRKTGQGCCLLLATVRVTGGRGPVVLE